MVSELQIRCKLMFVFSYFLLKTALHSLFFLKQKILWDNGTHIFQIGKFHHAWTG